MNIKCIGAWLVLFTVTSIGLSQELTINRSTPHRPVFYLSDIKCQPLKNSTVIPVNYYSNLLHLTIAGNPSQIPIDGKYVCNNGVLKFQLKHDLSPRTSYLIHYFTGKVITTDTIIWQPNTELNKPIVKHIYPNGDSIPSNTLVFYVKFTEPMIPDEQAYKHVIIQRADSSVPRLIWRHNAYWSENNTLLILMVHPAYIKSNIDFDGEDGVLFKEGETIQLRVKTSLQSIQGKALEQPFSKSFFIKKRDLELPKLIHVKQINSRQIQVLFSEPMDYGGIQNGLSIIHSSGKEIPITIKHKDNGILWTISTLDGIFEKGNYMLISNEFVKDIARNTLRRKFETENIEEMKSGSKDIRTSFQIK